MSVNNQARSRVVQLIFVAVFLIIVGQLLNLQIFSSKYRLEAENNARYRKVIYPDRGIVYDRKKRAVLENTIMYDLIVTPSEIKGTDTATLCNILGIDTAEFKKRIVEVIIKNGRVRPSIFEALLSPQVFARLNENIYKLPGFILQERPVRSYPYDAAAHILGYLGEVDTSFLRRHAGEGYEMGDYAGLTGLERTYEKVLMGQRGIQYYIRDNKSRLQGKYENGDFDTVAVAGRNLYTSLDVEVQLLAEKLLQNKIGSAVAINPKTGGIIAMASTPGYKPSELTGSERRKNYGRLALDTARPLLNRAIKGQYPPGSTFKPLGGLVALDERLITPSFGYGCAGVYWACGFGKPKCTHKNPGHARDLRTALANSCNSYFTQVFRMAIDNPRLGSTQAGYLKWKEYMNAFGLGVRLGIDLPSEDAGNIPDTSRYNKDFAGPRWNSCNILTLGIGQDRMLATPLQLANMMAVIANKGYYYTPHVVDSIEDETVEDTVYMSRFRKKHAVTNISDADYEAVHLGMQDVTEYGTAVGARITGIDICAKTGTAQNPHGEEHSIFVAFAPRQDPKIAIAVIVENAGFGSTWAAPIASLMMEKYLKDSISIEKQPEIERIATSDLIPAEIKRWYRRKDSIRQAKLAIIESNMPKLQNNLENRKVTEDPETERGQRGSGQDSTVPQPSPMILNDEKKNKERK
jgi:penicillin-binding protein 2